MFVGLRASPALCLYKNHVGEKNWKSGKDIQDSNSFILG